MFVSLFIVLLWVGLATYGDVCIKQAASVRTPTFWLGFACYALTSFLALIAFHRQQWGWIIIVWNCLALAVGISLSVFIFHEDLTPRRIIASVLVAIGIVLAE